MSYFKLAILAVFSLSIVAGIAIFALSKNNTNSQSADVVLWGTIPQDTYNNVYGASGLSTNRNIKITYVQKAPQDFDSDFVNALAEGNGPDIVLLRDDLFYKNRNKLVTIPYKSYSERTFKDTFIEGSEMFLSQNGVIAIPFMVDPMVMYWNRDIFTNAQISQPPVYWEQMSALVSKLTKKDGEGNIFQSTLPFGGWSNVTNAKEILSMLFMQAGTPITARSEDAVISVLDSQFQSPTMPGESALDFYTQFSNQTSSMYTWNRSLPSSLNSFLSGNLAIYIGFANELFRIREKNSNLNYDIAMVPQVKDSPKKIVFGRIYGFAITKQSKQIAGSFAVINALTNPASLLALEKITSLPPVRRDMLANIPSDAYRNVFYRSALISHSFIDPNPIESSRTFMNMVDSVTSGRSRVSDALDRASSELNSELK